MNFLPPVLKAEGPDGPFKLRSWVVFLLAELTGIPEDWISDVHVYQRFKRWKLLPWYRASRGGGAITLGPAGRDRIIFTENYFDPAPGAFNHGTDAVAWLSLLAHEVRHLKHIRQHKTLAAYLLFFAGRYAAYRSHDRVPEEIWAEEGRVQFDSFMAWLAWAGLRPAFDQILEGGNESLIRLKLESWLQLWRFNLCQARLQPGEKPVSPAFYAAGN